MKILDWSMSILKRLFRQSDYQTKNADRSQFLKMISFFYQSHAQQHSKICVTAPRGQTVNKICNLKKSVLMYHNPLYTNPPLFETVSLKRVGFWKFYMRPLFRKKKRGRRSVVFFHALFLPSFFFLPRPLFSIFVLRALFGRPLFALFFFFSPSFLYSRIIIIITISHGRVHTA